MKMKQTTKEKPKTGGIRWSFFACRKQWLHMAIIAIVCALYAALNTWFAMLTMRLIDAASGGEREAFVRACIFLSVLLVAEIVLGAARRYLSTQCQVKTAIALRCRIFESILSKRYDQISLYHSGELLNRIVSDTAVVSDTITAILPDLVTCVVQLLLAGTLLLRMDTMFTVILLSGGIVLYGVGRLIAGKVKRYHKSSQQADGATRAYMQEALSSLLVIKVFHVFDRIREKNNELHGSFYRVQRSRNLFSTASATCFTAVAVLSYAFSLFWCANRLLTDSAFTFGMLTAIQQLVSRVRQPLTSLFGMFPRMANLAASAERLMELESLPKEDCSAQKRVFAPVGLFISNDMQDVSLPSASHMKTTVQPTEKKVGDVKKYIPAAGEYMEQILLQDVSFSYDGTPENRVLSHMNLSVKRGDFVALTGHSGIGKSTVFRLLLGVYDTYQGHIQLCTDRGSYEVGTGTRGLFAYVPQGNFLFSGTILENVTLLSPHATMEQVWQALKIACMDTFVQSLEDGLDTVLRERGEGLSEGQMQRLALARAVLSGAQVLLLDEATSALDEATEAQLLQNLRALPDQTCLIVTHRPAALAICNKTVTMEGRK